MKLSSPLVFYVELKANYLCSTMTNGLALLAKCLYCYFVYTINSRIESCKIKMQSHKVCQRLGDAPPDPCVLDLQPVETPSKNPGYASGFMIKFNDI